MTTEHTAVAVIMPVHNAASFLDDAIRSVVDQTYAGQIELCIYDDASSDGSREVIEAWRERLSSRKIDLIVGRAPDGTLPRGCGFASNRAIELGTAPLLCFLDADDIMMPERVAAQVHLALERGSNYLVGCNLERDPPGSTERYIGWLSSLDENQLMTQRFVECTLAKPSWFMWRSLFSLAGPFDEGGKGVPEDLMFLYRAIELGALLCKVPRSLTVYRYHAHAASLSVTEESIMVQRVRALERQILSGLPSFSIWGAGKTGKRFYKLLSPAVREKVAAFGDVKQTLLTAGFFRERGYPAVPIVHFSALVPPIVMCVKRGLSGGALEAHIASRNLQEGSDLIYFA